MIVWPQPQISLVNMVLFPAYHPTTDCPDWSRMAWSLQKAITLQSLHHLSGLLTLHFPFLHRNRKCLGNRAQLDPKLLCCFLWLVLWLLSVPCSPEVLTQLVPRPCSQTDFLASWPSLGLKILLTPPDPGRYLDHQVAQTWLPMIWHDKDELKDANCTQQEVLRTPPEVYNDPQSSISKLSPVLGTSEKQRKT